MFHNLSLTRIEFYSKKARTCFYQEVGYEVVTVSQYIGGINSSVGWALTRNVRGWHDTPEALSTSPGWDLTLKHLLHLAPNVQISCPLLRKMFHKISRTCRIILVKRGRIFTRREEKITVSQYIGGIKSSDSTSVTCYIWHQTGQSVISVIWSSGASGPSSGWDLTDVKKSVEFM